MSLISSSNKYDMYVFILNAISIYLVMVKAKLYIACNLIEQ